MRKVWVLVPAIAFLLMLGTTAAFQTQEKAPGVVILKGNPMGGVKFDHAAHVKKTADKCEICHHASKHEKPLKSPHENCQDCHTSKPAPPMKTTARGAFHDGPGKKGICIDCHLKEAAAKKGVPVKCADCHKKANGV